jgi:hypothetical protein
MRLTKKLLKEQGYKVIELKKGVQAASKVLNESGDVLLVRNPRDKKLPASSSEKIIVQLLDKEGDLIMLETIVEGFEELLRREAKYSQAGQ